MKRWVVCGLLIVLLFGCTQALFKDEKPVDPPVIEEPQKPVEQEKLEEET